MTRQRSERRSTLSEAKRLQSLEKKSSEFVAVARVLRPQGRRGEVAVELLTDFPEQFKQRRTLSAVSRSGDRRRLELEDFWTPVTGAQRGAARLVMKFAGVDSISAAETLAGCELQIPCAERAELEPGSAYASDLIGCRVMVASPGSEPQAIGAIEDVVFGAGEAPLLMVHSTDGRELMVPFAAAYIQQLDIAGKRLLLDLPAGMLELDAPLTAEEKAEQRRK